MSESPPHRDFSGVERPLGLVTKIFDTRGPAYKIQLKYKAALVILIHNEWECQYCLEKKARSGPYTCIHVTTLKRYLTLQEENPVATLDSGKLSLYADRVYDLSTYLTAVLADNVCIYHDEIRDTARIAAALSARLRSLVKRSEGRGDNE